MMILGHVGIQNYYNKVSSASTRSALEKIAERLLARQPQNYNQPNVDRVELSSSAKEYARMHGYGCTMQRMEFEYEYRPAEPMNIPELLPPSEVIDYTEHDALMNQYMKQYRFEEGKPMRLCAPGMVSDEKLENFRKELNENGLGEDIDWRGVIEDFSSMDIRLGNVERLETKADYIASRYAVLKDRIQTQYAGDEQKAQMDKLDSIYNQAKEEMADTYAKNIGGFYEDLGQTGVIEDMRSSVLAMVDEKEAAYETYLAGAGDYANLKDSEDSWLAQDDAYLAARLRDSFAADGGNIQSGSSQAVYSGDDLTFAGVYAKSLSQQIKDAGHVWEVWRPCESDSELGKFLAKQYQDTRQIVSDAGISDKLAGIIQNTFRPFMEKFMDALDGQIDKNLARVENKPWMGGVLRLDYINRNAVYRMYLSIIGK